MMSLNGLMKVNESGFVERITMQISQTKFDDDTITIIPDGEVEECEYVRVDLYEQLEEEKEALLRVARAAKELWSTSYYHEKYSFIADDFHKALKEVEHLV